MLIAGIVDLDGFSPTLARPPHEHFLIGYCGSLNEAKDGVLSLIWALGGARASVPQCDLRLRVIAGHHTPMQIASVRGLVSELGLGDVVSGTSAWCGSACPAGWLLRLGASRPRSRQAEGGFPTKLGEYLATGRPVIVTAVGSIPLTIRHAVDAVLIPPNSPSALCSAIVGLVSDPAGCERLAVAARERAEAAWDPAVQAAVLGAFVHERAQRRA